MGSWLETTMRLSWKEGETTSFESESLSFEHIGGVGGVITPGIVMTFGIIRLMAQKSSMETKFNWSKQDDLDNIFQKQELGIQQKLKIDIVKAWVFRVHRWVLQRKMNLGVMKIKNVVDTPSITEKDSS